MNTVFILDKDTKTELSEELKIRILEIVNKKGHTIEMVELGKYDVSPCLGCFFCVTKHPGECVNKDMVSDIKKNVQKYGLLRGYLCVLDFDPQPELSSLRDGRYGFRAF